jgi:hypothetical protein
MICGERYSRKWSLYILGAKPNSSAKTDKYKTLLGELPESGIDFHTH